MIIGNIDDLTAKDVVTSEAKFTTMKVLVSPDEGWEGYVMRVVEVGETGYTPKHSHPWQHINYMIEGNGEIMIDGKINKVKPGSYAFIPPGVLHQFRNVGSGIFKFICIVPKEGHIY